MFSVRTGWNAAANPLSEAIARRRARGLELLDLTESNPTRVGLGFPEEALRELLSQPGNARYEPDPFGMPRAREAVAGYYGERGVGIDPAQVLLTASTSEGYAWLFKLLCDPGDEVLVPAPSYPLFEFLAGLEAVHVAGYPLRYDGEWHLDVAELATRVTPRTRALVVVSPNNPTGSYLKRSERAGLGALCREHDLALVSDEVFADYELVADDTRATSVLEEPQSLVFALSGLSKVAALPQLKLGWLVVGGPAHLRDAALLRLEIIADSYLSVGTPPQRALAALLARRAPVQRAIRERVRANLEVLRGQQSPQAPWQVLRVEGGWSAVLRIPRSRSEQEWVVGLAEEQGVVVHPGFFFDFPGEGFLALSLIVEPRVFREGTRRLARALSS